MHSVLPSMHMRMKIDIPSMISTAPTSRHPIMSYARAKFPITQIDELRYRQMYRQPKPVECPMQQLFNAYYTLINEL